MTNIISVLSFYFLLFLFYSVGGWILEVIYCVIDDTWINKKFTIENRGFLNGPYCPIYGVAGVAMAVLLTPIADNNILLFFVGIVVCDFVEYMTSVIMEKIFHARWWDYSHEFLNLNGRICFKHSMMWGVLSLVFIKFIHPPVLELFQNLDSNTIFLVSTSSALIFFWDLFNTLLTTISIRSLQSQLYKIKSAFSNFDPKSTLSRTDIPLYTQEFRDMIKHASTNRVRPRIIHVLREYPEILRIMREEIAEIQSVPSEYKKELKFMQMDLETLMNENKEEMY